MGVYIKGMEMPTRCYDCFALDDHGYYSFCLITHEQRGYNFCARKNKMDRCPLAEIPDRHRELIDRNDTINKLRAELKSNCDSSADWFDGFCSAMNYIKSSPTLIEGGKK